MWCQQCQQDVPVVAGRSGGPVVCARCHNSFGAVAPTHATGILDNGIDLDAHAENQPVDPVAKLSDYKTDQKIRRIGRVLRNGPAAVRATTTSTGGPHLRFDPPQDLFSSGEAGQPHRTRQPIPQQRQKTSLRNQAFAWLVVAIGMVMFGGGVGLGIWSVVKDLHMYRDASVALVLVGQGLLVVGLVLVVSRLWRNSRYATSKLQEVHWQLGQVQQTAQTILGTNSTSAPAFYAELSRGASTPMLLASLKGQLDQLSGRVDAK